MALAIGGQTKQLFSNLSSLGPKKLGVLGLVGLMIVGLIGLGSYFLSRPDMETLYSGLDRTDVSRIGAALTDAGIPFDVDAKGDAILTPFSQTAPARMLLAEKGLPRSENSGYELFDNLGSIGLTSFMQQVTRKRAIEGEIARTIQTLNGVIAARVHIVLPDEGSFRREKQKPSASVVIRTENPESFNSAQAIRSLVASAIPQMTPDEVTILNANGTLLATGDDTISAAPTKLFGIQSIVSKSIEEQVRRTLAPYLGVGNFQTSVSARLNTDRRQTDEKTFDPDSRVERSTRTVRESGESKNSNSQEPTGVEADIRPADEQQSSGSSGQSSSDQNDRREETTNYEINEKTVSTTSDGYTVERLSIAVVVDRNRVAAVIGKDATPQQIEAKVAEIKALVASAAGYTASRGDQLQVTAVDFLKQGDALEPVPAPGFFEMAMRQSGTLINALTILVVAVLVIWFGLKPAIKALTAQPALAIGDDSEEPIGLMADGFEGAAPASDVTGSFPRANGMDPAMLEDLDRAQANSPQARLEQLIDYDEVRAAKILKEWLSLEQAA